MRITIDDRQLHVTAGTTVLKAAREAGISIPTLCDHPDLKPFGGCRLCVVAVRGRRNLAPACTLEVSEGLEIETSNEQVIAARHAVLGLLLSDFHDADLAAGQSDDTEFSRCAAAYGFDLARDMATAPQRPIDADANPFIRVDMNKCIQCTRCIRACADLQGRLVWGLSRRGHAVQPNAGTGGGLLDGRCESCGACVAYCPTGALDNRMSYGAGAPDRIVQTTCGYCGVGCQIELNIRDERILRVTTKDPGAVNGRQLCVKGRYGYDYVHHPDRLTKPRVRRYLLEGGPKRASGSAWDWVETDWNQALDLVADRLAAIRNTHGADAIGLLSSAKCLNEENFLMGKLARQVLGTNNLDHCARL